MTKQILTLFLAILMLTGCGSPENLAPAQSAAAGELPDADAAALADFSLDLLNENWCDNVLVSPLSVLCALGMTANGAEGNTLAQMEDVLGLPAASLNETLGAWMGSLAGDDVLKLANSIWFRNDGSYTPADGFLDTAGKIYGAEVIPSKMDAAAVDAVNQWVEKRTGGMIERIVDEIPESTMLCLINALSMDAEWEEIYTDRQISDGVFTTEDGAEQAVKLMYSSESRYLSDDNARGFLKLYKGGRWAFCALLPDEGVSLKDYAAGLTGEHLRALLNAEDTLVETAIPKFEVEFSADLNDCLINLGMPDAFDMSLADFSGMGDCLEGPLFISRVLHKTRIQVDERGTKAGAVTAVAMDAGAAMDPLTVYLDRPFLYMLVDLETNLPVFIGAVTSLG